MKRDVMNLARSKDVVQRSVAGESILVPIRGNVADMQRLYALDAVAECVWDCLDGERGLVDIAVVVAEKFDVDQETAEKDVGLFLDDLLKNELIVRNGN